MFNLPNNLREELKEPMGVLVDEKELIKVLKDKNFIVSIGDIVTYTILKNDIEPIFCIVDYHTRRGKCEDNIVKKIKSYGKKTVKIKNKPATISEDLIKEIKNAYENLENNRLIIEIIGEEDLASLPAIYYAPSNVTIIYGLPDKGVLIVRPTINNKNKIKEIFDKM